MYELRHLHRFPLRTPYREVASHVVDPCWKEPLRYAKDATLVIDATGVGAPVYEDIEKKLKDSGITGYKSRRASSVDLKGVLITGGDDTKLRSGILARTQTRSSRCRGSASRKRSAQVCHGDPHVETLLGELQNFRVKITASGHESYERREGEHDDLVLALAMAAWWADRQAKMIGARLSLSSGGRNERTRRHAAPPASPLRCRRAGL